MPGEEEGRETGKKERSKSCVTRPATLVGVHVQLQPQFPHLSELGHIYLPLLSAKGHFILAHSTCLAEAEALQRVPAQTRVADTVKADKCGWTGQCPCKDTGWVHLSRT